MTISPLAGKPAPKEMLIDPAQLERDYFERKPDLDDPGQLVSFGTSGHRGSPLRGSFTEAHILAITQAICDYRRAHGADGPLYMGKDTHAVSGPAQRTALEVLAANEVQTIIQRDDGFTPTPVISRAILVYNRARAEHLADGIVITPSHNPPKDGGFKYNPTNGGPADTDVTKWVENRANELLRNGNAGVKRVGFTTAFNADTTHQEDFVLPYVNDLRNVVDMEAIRAAGLELAVDPLGGAAVHYWEPINAVYGHDLNALSFAFAGVAESGTLALVSGGDNPTTLNFLPENHVAVVKRDDIVADYEAVFVKLRAVYGKGGAPRTLNLITGPSRSADIEQTLLLGAHGPRRLHIVIAG